MNPISDHSVLRPFKAGQYSKQRDRRGFEPHLEHFPIFFFFPRRIPFFFSIDFIEAINVIVRRVIVLHGDDIFNHVAHLQQITTLISIITTLSESRLIANLFNQLLGIELGWPERRANLVGKALKMGSPKAKWHRTIVCKPLCLQILSKQGLCHSLL